MLTIDKQGWVQSPLVHLMRRPNLQHGDMKQISGIIVHQTGASTAQSSLDSYLHTSANGAHFLIDKDGTIYQTGSVFWSQHHVGKLRSKCLSEHTCQPIDAKALAKMSPSKMNTSEMKKQVPDRYPSNQDAIGIELVGGTIGTGNDPVYETVTAEQNKSLAWLIGELRQNFGVPLNEIFRHPVVSRKDPHEAETARW